ncbi:MAG TPA: CUAEP/CCAEP-tail radical SAM protein, partial [Polyangia bacterium]|nr:CUAEP/CCAEP-tail radical SAM protein [Polyangia bacterium]
RHITFGDADFLNGPTHARAVAQALAARFPGTTFDVTAKIEHLIGHAELLPLLARAGCVFVVSAVESLSDTVLAHLQKGHTRADVVQALALVRAAGLALRPSLVSFTPWTTLDDYLDVLDWVDAEGLWEHVDPVQWTIRLLVPPGSLLEHDPVMTPHLGRLVPSAFAYEWRHPDARMDRLHAQVTQAVKQGVREERAARVIFEHVRAHAEAWARPEERRSRPRKKAPPRQRRPVPRLTEPWFC